MPVKGEKFDKDGKPYTGVMKLENHMKPGFGYTIRELQELTGRSYTRIVYKLRELENLNPPKAECKLIDSVTYWRLTPLAYTEGTVEIKETEKRPGRPSKWIVDGQEYRGPTHYEYDPDKRRHDESEESDLH